MTVAARTLLASAIDYAGMYWPAKLDLATTVANYAAYRSGPDAWALGRLVLPDGRAADFAHQWPAYARTWPVAYVITPEVRSNIALKPADAAELPALPTREAELLRHPLGSPGTVFVETTLGDDLPDRLQAFWTNHVCAKLRLGGPGPDFFPPPADLANLLAACIVHHVPAKATAGLHHALRGVYPITDDDPSEPHLTPAPSTLRVPMHGFVNLFLAAALLANGGDVPTAVALLEDTAPTSFSFTDTAATWRDHAFSIDLLQQLRNGVLLSFGSCSFTELLVDMRAKGWLS